MGRHEIAPLQKVRVGASLCCILDAKLEPEDMAWDHSMDISGTVYRRMEALGISKSELASRMGVTPARVTRILKGEQSMTLKTLAKLEYALDIDMSEGFRHPRAFSDALEDEGPITLSSEFARQSIRAENAHVRVGG